MKPAGRPTSCGRLPLEVRRTLLMPQGNAELMERESAAVRHVYVVLNVFLRGREIAGSAHFAGAVPGEHLDGGILRKNAGSDLQSNGDAKVNLEDPHSRLPLPFPSLKGARVCSGCKPGSSEYFTRAWRMGRRGLATRTASPATYRWRRRRDLSASHRNFSTCDAQRICRGPSPPRRRSVPTRSSWP